jgi:6-phosphogluconolactonase
MKKGVTKKEHQRNLKRFKKAVEESNVVLRKAGMWDKNSQAQGTTSVEIFPDVAALTAAAGERFVRVAQDAVARRGVFTVALSGGSTPKGLYTLMAKDKNLCGDIPWSKIHFFFGDERQVPPDQADSNFHMVNQAMFQRLAPGLTHIHRILGEFADAAEAASRYEVDMRDFFESHGLVEAGFPRFDLIFLGMGSEGHTASLFPESLALQETHRWVVANWVEKFKAHRITMTFPVLNNAAEVVLLVAGVAKAPIVVEVLERTATTPRYPVQRVKPCNGTKCWMLDKAAASQLAKVDA